MKLQEVYGGSELLNPMLNPYNAPHRLDRPVYILDSTLREGEQASDVYFTKGQKLQLAWMLDRLGVDMIEISPIVSKEHEEVCRELIKAGLKAEVVAHARATVEDVDLALKCDARWVALFMSVSDVHLKSKLKIGREEALGRVMKVVEYAKSHGLKVRFSAEDASRADADFLRKVASTAEGAGVDRLGITDTVGIMFPRGMYNLVKVVKEAVRKVELDVHCHNDLGLALANALAGVEAGASQIHATINGLGERVGMPSIAEVAVALTLLGARKDLRLETLTELSQLASSYLGQPPPDRMPIVGGGAFKHKSGTHIMAVLADPRSYEPFPPSLVGNRRKLVFGRYSGASAVAFMLDLMGLKVGREEARMVAQRIKDRWRDLELEVAL